MWAPLFKISKQHILWLLIGVILLKTVLSIVGHFYITNELFQYLMSIFKFEAMAVGGLGAYLVFTKGEVFVNSVLFKLPVQIMVFAVLVTFLTFHINIDNVVWDAAFRTPVFSSLLVDALFLYLILCVSVVDHSIVKFRSKALSFLGEISYGIYMYHLLAIFITIHFLKPDTSYDFSDMWIAGRVDEIIDAFNSPLRVFSGSTDFVGKKTLALREYKRENPKPQKTPYRDWETDRKSTRLNSSHRSLSRMPSSA